MGVETKRYIRKPLYVDAVRVTTQNFDEIAEWCDGKVDTGEVPPGSGKKKKYIKVHVLQPKNPRQTMAFVGDWLLYTNGNYKIYTDKAFKRAFDLVEEERAGGTSADVPRDNTDNPMGAAKEKRLPPQPRYVGGNVEIRDMRVVAEEPDPTGTGVQPIESVDENTTPQGEPHEYVEATPQAIADAVRENEEARLAEGAQEFAEEDQAIAEGQPEEIEETEASEETPRTTPNEADLARTEARRARQATESEQPSEVATRKRVLSEHEQQVLGPDEVRQMVRSGDVILAQDLATEQS